MRGARLQHTGNLQDLYRQDRSVWLIQTENWEKSEFHRGDGDLEFEKDSAIFSGWLFIEIVFVSFSILPHTHSPITCILCGEMCYRFRGQFKRRQKENAARVKEEKKKKTLLAWHTKIMYLVNIRSVSIHVWNGWISQTPIYIHTNIVCVCVCVWWWDGSHCENCLNGGFSSNCIHEHSLDLGSVYRQ